MGLIFSIEQLTANILTILLDSVYPDNQVTMRIWGKEVDGYVYQKGILECNVKKVFNLIWEQVTPVLKSKIKSMPSFNRVNTECDAILLLTILRTKNQ